jgi:5-hydroxyisourate hydrolase-like protein (transthyretin family)
MHDERQVRIMKSLSRIWMPLVFSAAFITIVTVDAAACSCMFGGAAPCSEYWKTDTIFEGTVVGESKVKVVEGSFKFEKRLVRFDLVESFRGAQGAQLEVITGWGGGDCGYEFERGETYLVYAYRDEKDNRLYTSICSRTRPLADAAEDISFMRNLGGADAGAVVFGKVKKRNYQWVEGEEVFKPVGSAELIIEGEGASLKARTDAQGNYRVIGLAPGAYKVKLKLPEGLTDDGAGGSSIIESKVEVVARGCAGHDFYLEADTRLSGRVLDVEGRPAANIRLQIRGAPSDTRNGNTFLYAQTDADGHFEFKTVPPGDYLLGVHLLGDVGAAPLGYPRTYYPGVSLGTEAKVISVKEGEHLSNLEMRLPPRLLEYSVVGFVVWSDGRPAPGVYIYISLQEEEERAVSLETIRADERGRFTLKLFEGRKYKVSAYPENASGNAAQSEWVEVLQAHRTTPLKLVLPTPKK